MKTLIFLVSLLFCIISCSSLKNNEQTSNTTTNQASSDTIRIANDSLEYEVLIIEPGFNAWLLTQQPRNFYTTNYLESRNRLNVIEYNQRVLRPQQFDRTLYEQQINYSSSINYGHEVNYVLFHYFLFFEERYRQRLRN